MKLNNKYIEVEEIRFTVPGKRYAGQVLDGYVITDKQDGRKTVVTIAYSANGIIESLRKFDRVMDELDDEFDLDEIELFIEKPVETKPVEVKPYTKAVEIEKTEYAENIRFEIKDWFLNKLISDKFSDSKMKPVRFFSAQQIMKETEKAVFARIELMTKTGYESYYTRDLWLPKSCIEQYTI